MASDDVKLVFQVGAADSDRIPIVARDLERFNALADTLCLSAIRAKALHKRLREKATNGMLDISVLNRCLAALAREQGAQAGGEAGAAAGSAVDRVFQALMSSSQRVSTVQMATALSMFSQGSKSEKLALAFRFFDLDGDGELSREEAESFLEAFLTPILGLCDYASSLSVNEVRRVVAGCVAGVCERMMPAGEQVLSFDALKAFYNTGGFGIVPWLELLDLSKWPTEGEDAGSTELLAFELTSAGDVLRITQRDVDNLSVLLQKTGFAQMEPDELADRFAVHASKGMLTREGFDAAIRDLVPRSLLDPNDVFFLARVLCYLFYAYDHDNQNWVPLHEFVSGFVLLAAGCKSDKLHLAFRLFNPNDDGGLTREQLARFLGSFLTALLTLGQQSDTTPARELQVIVSAAAAEAADKVFLEFEGCNRISFIQFGQWYNNGGYVELRWLELLDLRKWPSPSDGSSSASASEYDGEEEDGGDDEGDEGDEGEGDERYAADVNADDLDGLNGGVQLLDFVISDADDVLQFTAKDVRALRRLVRATGMAELVVEDLYAAFADAGLAQLNMWRVNKDTFEELLGNVIDPALLEEEDDISDALFAAFFMLTDDREEASLVELLSGLSVFIGGSKSHKLYNAFELFDADDDGALSREEMERYLGSFLSVLLSLSGSSDPDVVTRAISHVCDRVFASAADEQGLCSFEAFAEMYTAGGFEVMMWLELLDLRKWPGSIAVENPGVYADWGSSAAADGMLDDDDDSDDSDYVPPSSSSGSDSSGSGSDSDSEGAQGEEDEEGDEDEDEDDVVVYRFRMDDAGRMLEISHQDIANLEYVASKTRLQSVTVERVLSLFESQMGGRPRCISEDEFDAVVRELVPGLSNAGKRLLSTSLGVVFRAFDRVGSGEASFAEVVSGVCLFAAGGKSNKLHSSFELFDEDEDGALTRGQMFRYLRSFLTVLFALSSEVGAEPAEIARRTRAGATTAVKLMFEGRSEDAVVSFAEFADWYTDGAYEVVPYLELLDLQKWALLRSFESADADADADASSEGESGWGGGTTTEGETDEDETEDEQQVQPPLPPTQAEQDGLVFSFDVAPGFKLQITAADIDTLNAILSKTRLHTVELERLYEVFQSEARDGRLSKRAFNACVQTLVPADVLTPEDKQYLTVSLSNVFYSFDRLKRHEVDVSELLAGFSVLAAGSKSLKLAHAFSLLDADGDGRLTRREVWKFMRAFLMVLVALNHCSTSTPSDALFEAADACAVEATALMFGGPGSAVRSIDFATFSSWYNSQGYTYHSWIELLDLSKWPHSAAGSRPGAEDEEPAAPVVFGFELTDFVLTIDERDLAYLERVLSISGFDELSVDELLGEASGPLLAAEGISFDEAVDAATALLPGARDMVDLEHEFLRGVLRDLFHGYRVVAGGAVRGTDFLTGLSLLVAGSKSAKLAATFELAGEDGDGLSGDELARYLCAFLTALLVLSNASQADLDKCQGESYRIASRIFEQQGLRPNALLSFDAFAAYYSATGYLDIPWLELLNLAKWPLQTSQ